MEGGVQSTMVLTGRKSKNRNINKCRRRMSRRVFGDSCFYCDGPPESFDHFTPFSAGGLNKWFNLVPACHRCNRLKKSKLPTPEQMQKHADMIAKALAQGLIKYAP